jgi:hypothetical protein
LLLGQGQPGRAPDAGLARGNQERSNGFDAVPLHQATAEMIGTGGLGRADFFTRVCGSMTRSAEVRWYARPAADQLREPRRSHM